MDLRQISVSFEQEQDRLLLRTLSAGGSQAQAWLTRRLMLRLWPVLQQIVIEHAALPASPHALLTPEARRMLTDSAREAALSQAELSLPYEGDKATEHPLGTEPLLPVKVEMNVHPEGRYHFGFKDGEQRGFELELGSELMHVLLHLLEEALRAAEWGVVREAAPREAEAGARPHPLRLN